MKTVGIVQARMGSTRVPGKVMRDLSGTPVFEWAVDGTRDATGVDEVWVATSDQPADQVISNYCHENDIKCWRGSETDVISRYLGAAEASQADILIRITADCPFVDAGVIAQVVKLRERERVDYASNVDPATWPDGLDCEVFTLDALKAVNDIAIRDVDRDCVTTLIRNNKYRFSTANLVCPLPGLEKERWVLDTEEDWEFCQQVVAKFVEEARSWPRIDFMNILSILDKHPEIRRINSHLQRNERYFDHLATESVGQRSCPNSKALLSRARRTIPLGSQTFSKSHIQFPTGSPLYCTHGDGGYIYDVDGHEYVDLVSGLLPVILGYRDPDVDAAIRRQLDRGISFSLATELEAKVAERLKIHIPCAEMSRFFKTGSDVCTAAVRVARHFTGRDKILSSGYHGWHDWAVASDPLRQAGVPAPIGALTTMFAHGDTDTAAHHLQTEKYACVIVEPETNPDHFLEDLYELCELTNTVLIFDEVITGFRFGLGGAQQYFGVKPDLATFGKAMGNGMPIGAVSGRADIMKLFEPPRNIFASGTFGGEALSLAACLATMDKLEALDVAGVLAVRGKALASRIEPLLPPEIKLSGHPSVTRLTYADEKVKTVFIREMIRAGVLIIASNNLNYAHRDAELRRVVHAYEHACHAVKNVGAVKDLLRKEDF